MTTIVAQQVALDNALVQDWQKRFTLNMEVFIEIFQICPKLPNQEFDALPSDEEIVSFIKELGHKGDIKSVSDAVVNHMHQP
ncbi:hypothetical protein Tco_1060143 [Tanacetum coccineum]